MEDTGLGHLIAPVHTHVAQVTSRGRGNVTTPILVVEESSVVERAMKGKPVSWGWVSGLSNTDLTDND